MKIIIEFSTDNDSFQHEGFIVETCRLIDQAKLTAMDRIDGEYSFHDINGNRIGGYIIEGTEIKDEENK